MTEKIRLEIEDATSPGLQAFDDKLNDLAHDANKVEKELNDIDRAEKRIGDEGGGGKGGVGGLGMKLIGANQALELFKKFIGGAHQAITALAADGNPAFVELQKSIAGVHGALLDLGTDPDVANFASNLADSINNDLIPAIARMPDWLRETRLGLEVVEAEFKEMFGLVSSGERERQLLAGAARLREAEQQKKQNQDTKQRMQTEQKLGEIEKQISQQGELTAMARLTSERTVKDALDDELDTLKDLMKQGRSTRDEQERSLQKIAVLQKRLVEIPEEQARAAQDAANEATKARIEAEQQHREELDKSAAAARQAEQEKLRAVQEAEELKREERKKSADQFATAGGEGLVKQAIQQIDPRRLREEVASRRADLVGFQGGTIAEIRQARRGAFHDFNRGLVSQEELGGAQQSIVQASLQQAQASGKLGSETVKNATDVMNTLQQAAQNQEAMAQQLQSFQSALQTIGASLKGTGQRVKAASLGR